MEGTDKKGASKRGRRRGAVLPDGNTWGTVPFTGSRRKAPRAAKPHPVEGDCPLARGGVPEGTVPFYECPVRCTGTFRKRYSPREAVPWRKEECE